ncbi:MAG: PEP-CTERM sorting domain-containing protein [Phycisphaeraceae bacterium]|nr:MAG: PEP-CTERM sorting domain-containing protein [Phycisphaeraceae bacterium]
MSNFFRTAILLGAGASFGVSGVASAQFVADPAFNSKANPQEITMSAGSTITGNSQSQADGTYFLVNIETAPRAIYRHRIVFETTEGAHRGWIRGLSQDSSGVVDPNSDVLVQATNAFTDPPVFNQWYGFGHGESFFYQVFGTSNTPDDYTATLSTEVVTPDHLGSFQPGEISITTIDQGHSTNTHLHVLDADLNPIPGFQNIRPDSSTFQSLLTRDFAPGDYFLAIGLRNTATDQPTPDDTIQRNQPVLDFPGMLLNGQPTISSQDVSFAMTDSSGTLSFDADRGGHYGVYWGSFTVVPTPGAVALFGLAGLGAMRRRR